MMTKLFQVIFSFLVMLTLNSCLEAAKNGRIPATIKDDSTAAGGGNGDGSSLTGQDGTVNGDSEEPIAKVEIRHLIEPKVDDQDDGGEHKRKLTIPKNYNGKLYVAGINITTLADQSISVRFKFGLDKAPIMIPALVSVAPGLTPQTNVQVLVLDLSSKPFQNVQLLYDLYDYNNYDFTGASSDPGVLTEPVDFNRNDKLFCRGLALKDDSTFAGNLVDGCVNNGDICKFAYAKVVDKGLVSDGNPDIPVVPTEPNVMVTSSYDGDDTATKLQRCLPDNPLLTGGAYLFDSNYSFSTFESSQFIDSQIYYYRGPYRTINETNWEIKAEALKGEYGLFKGIFDMNVDGQVNSNELEYGYSAKLFPLYTKFNLVKDTQYMGSVVADGEKTIMTMGSNGESLYMDGCNARATSVHEITGEHIGSCNVTATIEIVAKDDITGKETILDVTDEVKLQLVKPAVLNTSGDNVLLSSFQQCSSSSQCGSDSCCINNRCWSKSVVSQCIEDLPNFGNLVTGDLCTSDYQCSSLCCNKIDGRCAPHDTISDTPSYCSKPSGQSCVAKEWCQKHPVTTCAIVKTGTDTFGNQTCALRCITAEVYGECSAADGKGAGVCVPPCQPKPPVFNPNDPNRCENAVELSDLIFEANNPSDSCEGI